MQQRLAALAQSGARGGVFGQPQQRHRASSQRLQSGSASNCLRMNRAVAYWLGMAKVAFDLQGFGPVVERAKLHRVPVMGTQTRSTANPLVSFRPQYDPRTDQLGLTPDAGRQWYAVYTRARHEKQVAQRLQGRAVECFLPLQQAVHRWVDRRTVVALPLFSGYVFVRVDQAERMRVVTVPGVVQLVGTKGAPTPIPTDEIENVRNCVQLCDRVEAHPYLPCGTSVMIRRGPLAGLQGFLVRHSNGSRLVLSIALIESSIAVDVDAADVVPLHTLPVKSAHAG